MTTRATCPPLTPATDNVDSSGQSTKEHARLGLLTLGIVFALSSCGSSQDAGADSDTATASETESGLDQSSTGALPAAGVEPSPDANPEVQSTGSDTEQSNVQLGGRLACDLITAAEVSELTGFEMTPESIDLGSVSLGSNCNFDGSEGRVRIAVAEPERGARTQLEDAEKYSETAGLVTTEVTGYGDYAHELDGTLQVAVGGVVLQAFTERAVDISVAYDVMRIMINNL